MVHFQLFQAGSPEYRFTPVQRQDTIALADGMVAAPVARAEQAVDGDGAAGQQVHGAGIVGDGKLGVGRQGQQLQGGELSGRVHTGGAGQFSVYLPVVCAADPECQALAARQ